MTRDEIFAKLEEAGIVMLRTHYYGGGDEGFVDMSDVSYSEEYDFDDATNLLDDMGIDYIDLEEPVEAALGMGWYDGEPDVDGYVYWKVPERKVTIQHSYTDWVIEDEKEVG